MLLNGPRMRNQLRISKLHRIKWIRFKIQYKGLEYSCLLTCKQNLDSCCALSCNISSEIIFLLFIPCMRVRLEEKLSNLESANQAIQAQALAVSPTGITLSRPKTAIVQVTYEPFYCKSLACCRFIKIIKNFVEFIAGGFREWALL